MYCPHFVWIAFSKTIRTINIHSIYSSKIDRIVSFPSLYSILFTPSSRRLLFILVLVLHIIHCCRICPSISHKYSIAVDMHWLRVGICVCRSLVIAVWLRVALASILVPLRLYSIQFLRSEQHEKKLFFVFGQTSVIFAVGANAGKVWTGHTGLYSKSYII